MEDGGEVWPGRHVYGTGEAGSCQLSAYQGQVKLNLQRIRRGEDSLFTCGLEEAEEDRRTSTAAL